MTEVRIPVNVDVQSAAAALDRLVSALRKTGQAGKQFSDIDWNLPDLKKFSSDAQHMQAKFQDITAGRVRGATAQAVRSGKYPDIIAWAEGHSKQFTTVRERENHQANVLRYIGHDTQFGPGGGGGAPAGGASPFPVGGMMKGMAALAGIGGLMAMVGKGVSSASDEGASIDRLLRSVDDTSHSFDRFRSLVRQAGDNLQLSNEETARLTVQFAKLSNAATIAGAAGDTRNAVGFARSFGLAEDSTVAKFAQAKFLGATEQKQFAVMIADAIGSGKMWGKGDEVLASVVQWMQSSTAILARTPSISGYLDMQARMNASGVAGLMGGQGAALLGQLDQGVRHPGMGEAGTTFMWRAMSQGKALDPFEFKYRLEEGAFGGKKGGPTNLQLAMDTANQMYGRGASKEKLSALSNVFGISMHQWEELFKMGPVKAGRLSSRMGQLGITDFNATGLKDMQQILGADQSGLNDWRKTMLARGDVTQAQANTLTGASGEDLRDALLRVAAVTGREENEATKTQQSIKDLGNIMSETTAMLLEPLTMIRDVAVKFGGFMGMGENATPSKGKYALPDFPGLKAFGLGGREEGPADSNRLDVKIQLMDEDGTARARKEARVALVKARRTGTSVPVNAPELRR